MGLDNGGYNDERAVCSVHGGGAADCGARAGDKGAGRGAGGVGAGGGGGGKWVVGGHDETEVGEKLCALCEDQERGGRITGCV